MRGKQMNLAVRSVPGSLTEFSVVDADTNEILYHAKSREEAFRVLKDMRDPLKATGKVTPLP
jgi:hypothetical protein